jgi:hypothetical protein
MCIRSTVVQWVLSIIELTYKICIQAEILMRQHVLHFGDSFLQAVIV